MEYAIYLALFVPLIGFLGLVASHQVIGRQLTRLIGCGTVLFSFASFIYLLFMYRSTGMNPQTFKLFNWISVSGLSADFALHLDSLSLLMALIITGIGFLIHVYSIGYMDHEEDLVRYFACMNFFIFAMLLLVLANNLLLLFVGWEGVGLASYLLIGFWYNRPAAAQAATKAFVVNRIGDFGLLLGLLLTFYLFGTSDIHEVSRLAQQNVSMGSSILILLTLLYFMGAVGKSAQLPLHTWLPDAMEGPTPVSALIHAATMVTAGVYLVVRMHSVFTLAPETLQVIGIVGAITSLFAAIWAIGQIDLKRVLAYSTISQLGLMFLACGAGAFYTAMFHLMTHAFVKALLFLAAGNVIHMMHGITTMDKMGGLSKKFRITHWLFLIGALTMSGIPPFAIFFSKDLILEQEHLEGFDTLFYIGLATSILTAFYLTRAYCLTFMGVSQTDNKIWQLIKEAPAVMLIPVSVLALLSIFGGFLGFEFGKTPPLENFLAQIGIKASEHEFSTGGIFTHETLLAVIGAFLGVAVSALLYIRSTRQIEPSWALIKQGFYLDKIYEKIIVRPLNQLANWIVSFVEPRVVDDLINDIGRGCNAMAHWLQKLQSGQIRSYVAWMVIGMAFLLIYIAF